MIYRKEKTDGNFTQIDNGIARERNLSLTARGLMLYMLSCVDDWNFTAQRLQKETNTKRATIENALNELEICGFLKRETRREKGRFICEFKIFEYPYNTYLQELRRTDDNLLPF